MFQMKNDSSLNKLKADVTGVNERITRNRSVASAHPSNYPNLKLFESKQSPKMQSGKLRYDIKSESNQLYMPFSQLDLPLGKISRGTKVPAQFERKEMEKIFNQTASLGFYKVKKDVTINSQPFHEDDNNNKNLNQSKSFYMKEKNRSPISENTNTGNKFSNEVPEKSENEKSNLQVKLNTINASTESGNLRKNSSPGENLTLDNKNIPQESNFFNQTVFSNDKWMPKNFREHERQIKTAHARFRDPTNTLGDKLPNVSVKEIKKKAQESDIFFAKIPNKKEVNFDKVRENNHKSKAIDYQDSDIFMLKNNNLSLEKNAEKYLDAQNKLPKYNTSSRSNSEWQPKNAFASLLNHGSTKHNLLNPDAKNNSKTKEQIISESISLNNFNPILKQKSLCEFLDLTRVGVPNPNKEYLNALKKTKNAFGREANMCSTYLDLHRMYRGISDRPFVKKIV
jgi:hypothetical protein